MALNPGDTLFNSQYQILHQVGRGGFGFVYLARDTILDEQVAIKELIPALVGDEIILKRFLAEAKATMRLAHDRIVRTHNVFQEGGNYYIVMEYMPGGSLETRLQERGPLPVDEAVCIAAQVCDGLGYAHKRGVIHCDLKPANILFATDPQTGTSDLAKVADFGIAHVSDQMLSRSWLTPAGFVAGTLPYMSPEQTDGVREDPRVDIYAIGAVLYRMLAGRTYLNFDQRDTPRAQVNNVEQICSTSPVPPSTYNGHVPSWLDAVVLKALAKRPEERYASADQLRAALLQDEPARPLVAPAAALDAMEQAPMPSPPPAQPEAGPGPTAAMPQPTARPGRTSLPGWFWPMAGVAGVLLVALVIGVVVALGGGGNGADKAIPTATQPAVAQATSSSTPMDTRTPTPMPTTTRVLPSATLRQTATRKPSTAAPEPTPGSANPAFQVDVTSLLFFEGPDNPAPDGQRQYADRFPQKTTRYIYYEIRLKHPAPGHRVDLNLEAIYYRPNGSILGRPKQQAAIEAGWTWSYYHHRTVWGEVGQWPIGLYRVEIYIEGNKVATGTFEIY